MNFQSAFYTRINKEGGSLHLLSDPLFAIVPRLSMSSCRVMPMPKSSIMNFRSASSTLSLHGDRRKWIQHARNASFVVELIRISQGWLWFGLEFMESVGSRLGNLGVLFRAGLAILYLCGEILKPEFPKCSEGTRERIEDLRITSGKWNFKRSEVCFSESDLW